MRLRPDFPLLLNQTVRNIWCKHNATENGRVITYISTSRDVQEVAAPENNIITSWRLLN